MLFWFKPNPKKRRKRLISWASRYKIESLKEDYNISGLKVLIINHKRLDKLPSFLDCLSSLEVLNLSYNELSDLPVEIKNLVNLKELHLGFNKFKSIPPVVYELKNLEVLNFEGNEIITIDPNISQLSRLKDLNLMANRITGLPPEIGEITQLKRLNLAINQLKELPPTFSKLQNLTSLELWLNHFDTLPEEAEKLPLLFDKKSVLDAEQLNKTLIWAVIGDNIQLADKLIAYGADVNYKFQQSEGGMFTTPLFEARSISMITLLLTMGADPFLTREIYKKVKTREGKEIEKPTGKTESFITMKHPKEIEKYKQAYLSTLKLLEK